MLQRPIEGGDGSLGLCSLANMTSGLEREAVERMFP